MEKVWLEEVPSILPSADGFIWGRLRWVAHICNFSPGETEAGDSLVPGHPGLYQKILSQAKTN